MRRPNGLNELSRRELCVGACAGIVLASCVDGSLGPIQTGKLGPGSNELPDAPTGDGPDANMGGVCVGAAVDVGAASSFVLGTPVYFSNGTFFVVRDSGGLYALTSRCTHEGIVTMVQGTQFHCPKHDALFTFNGAVVSGPVINPLVHFAMCTLANGHVGVQIATHVAASTRLLA
jgi:nitrite reductase/ring-hydroxylating ferredoxin subunit